MSKHTSTRGPVSRQRTRTSRRTTHKRRSRRLTFLLLLAAILLASGLWALLHIPPGQLILGSIITLLVILLLTFIWLILRVRPTYGPHGGQAAQQMELRRMDDVANTIGARPVELNDLAHLTPTEFEDLVGILLESMGVAFDLERVGGARDRGVDLRGRDEFKQPFIVQCKRYFGRKVTPEKTREFQATRQNHRAREAWFVTTSTFTDQARQEVYELSSAGLMVLVDGPMLMTFIHDYWDALPHRWQWRLTECALAGNQPPDTSRK